MSVRHSLVNFVLISAVAAALACSLVSAQTQNFAALHKQAKEGNAEAQYELAKDYYTGTGVSKDSKQGLEWLRKSADQGHPGAEFALAVLYRKGELKDPKQGLVWLQKSAAHNNAAAEYELGCLFRDGEGGVSKNPHEAALWLRKAARQQNQPAQNAPGTDAQERHDLAAGSKLARSRCGGKTYRTGDRSENASRSQTQKQKTQSRSRCWK